MERNTLSPKEAAELLNMDLLTLRCWIQDGKCPFGYYYKRKYAKRGSYIISKSKLMDFIGAN